MRIVTARRVSQASFLFLFCWFTFVATFGGGLFETSGWPINLFLELDPLVGVATALSTQTLYKGLLWGLLTLLFTLLLGRVFCGWLCPFGTLHHFIGWLGRRARPVYGQREPNRYRSIQNVKYLFLFAFLIAAGAGAPGVLHVGLLDPMALLTRSVDLVVAPLSGMLDVAGPESPRRTTGVWVLGVLFLGTLLANLWTPRFFCRFLCPTGALLGLVSRFSLFRFVRRESPCTDCGRCESNCEGASTPSGELRTSECVACANCFDACEDLAIAYTTGTAPAGQCSSVDVSRRGFVASLTSGLATVPLLRRDGRIGTSPDDRLIRPPGSLTEEAFVARCIKCGRCMRACPTNVLQPAGFEHGLEALWTPVLNNRIGDAGCRLDCVACGHVCPTGAIRALSRDEKMGRGDRAAEGPVRVGLAFVDRSRCLPWAFDRPCLACERACPHSPKALVVREAFTSVRDGGWIIREVGASLLTLENGDLEPHRYASGDYVVRYVSLRGEPTRRLVVGNTRDELTLAPGPWPSIPARGHVVDLQIRHPRPLVDQNVCNGCGDCEHECPVIGLPAIRISAANESRSNGRIFLSVRD